MSLLAVMVKLFDFDPRILKTSSVWGMTQCSKPVCSEKRRIFFGEVLGNRVWEGASASIFCFQAAVNGTTGKS
jgi:hypothetical protein